MFDVLKNSISGILKTTIFDQAGNLPTAHDGPSLFRNLMDLTAVASLQLSVLSFQNLLEFDPSAHGLNIPLISKRLTHLFTLVTTQSRSLPDTERLYHTITVYLKI